MKPKRPRFERKAAVISSCFAVLLILPSCGITDSPLVKEARSAERDGRVISNELMAEMYPEDFVYGQPEYLERDFEAGADFICDKLERKYERDVCADPDVQWRK